MTNGREPLWAQPQQITPPKPWGYLSTFGWVLLAYVVATAVTVIALYLWDPATLPANMDLSALMKDAWYLGVSTIISDAVMVGFLCLVSRVGWRAKDYLAINWPLRQEVTVALISLVILLPLMDGLAYVSGQPIIPAFMTDIYKSAQSQGTLPLLWLAITVAAPVAEEIIFRGFIFRGWVRPSQRPMLGILAVAALFAIIHFQYNWFGILQVFMIGFLLTWTRWRSGSTLLPMVMHVVANTYAMLQVIVYLGWLS